MHSIEQLFFVLFVLTIVAAIDFFFLIGSYGILRLLRISVNWVTWIIGTLIIMASAYVCVAIFTRNPFAQLGNPLGLLSFLIAIYAASQWTTRRWYLMLKKQTIPFLTQQSRNVLLFLRKHHQFFGWLVVITAVVHTAYFLSFLWRVSLKMLITGVAALLILVLSLCYGLWIEYAVRKKRVAKNARIIHAIAAIAFFIAFLVHIGLGR